MERFAPGSRFLLLQLKRVGDVLLCTPVIRAIREARPEARIAFLTEEHNAEVLLGNPRIDELIPIASAMAVSDWLALRHRLKTEKPGIVIDFSGTPRSCLIAALSGAPVRVGFRVRLPRRLIYNIVEVPDRSKYTVDRRLDLVRAIGIPDRGFATELYLDARDRREADRLLRAAGFVEGQPILAVAPTSRKDAKRWTAEGFASVAMSACEDLGAEILLLAGAGEEEQEEAVRRILPRTVPRLPEIPRLRVLAALIERSNALLANDGGPKHLASALGVPSVTVFVSTAISSWHPPGDPTQIAVDAEENLNATIRRAFEGLRRVWREGIAPGALSAIEDPERLR